MYKQNIYGQTPRLVHMSRKIFTNGHQLAMAWHTQPVCCVAALKAGVPRRRRRRRLRREWSGHIYGFFSQTFTKSDALLARTYNQLLTTSMFNHRIFGVKNHSLLMAQQIFSKIQNHPLNCLAQNYLVPPDYDKPFGSLICDFERKLGIV